VDVDEAYRVGQAAVREAVAGQSDVLVSIVREPGPDYRSTTALAPLERVIGRIRAVPDEFIAGSGNDVTPAYLEYARPLIGGPLPPYARLSPIPIPKRAT
jgi:6-phosphofructokinase 1